MNCSEVQELFSAYYDGELAEAERSRVSDHLDECSNCAKELAGFQRLSNIAKALNTPPPPEQIWTQLERHLDQRPEQPAAESVNGVRSWSFLALAATVLVAAGVGWFTYQSWFAHAEHNQFAVDFGHYLDEFRRDPDAAQRILLAEYENQLIDPRQAIERVGYRPTVADGLPQGYTLASTHVVKMPCCTCVQSMCKRSDGSTLTIFERDDDSCTAKRCCLVELDGRIGTSWKRGARQLTLVGVRDDDEVNRMLAWLDERERLTPH